MYSYIEANAELLIADPKLAGAVLSYRALSAGLHQTDVSEDTEYQSEYRQFWALNAARVSEAWVRSYFSLLEAKKRNPSRRIEAVVRALASTPHQAPGRQALHFSFASKLLHMVTPTYPVYDSFVAAFYFYSPPPAGRSFDRRLAALLEFYRFLQEEYRRVVAKQMLDKASRHFRARLVEATNLSDEKVIDFLVWTFVRFLRNGAQRRGELLFA